MEQQELAARAAAEEWQRRNQARAQLRANVMELLGNKTMTQISSITGIRRTTLYYLVYGRSGKSNVS